MDRSLRAKVQLDSSKSFRYKYQLVTGTDARDDSVYRASIATRGKIIYSGLRHGHFLSVRGLDRKSIWLMPSLILTPCDGCGAEKMFQLPVVRFTTDDCVSRSGGHKNGYDNCCCRPVSASGLRQPAGDISLSRSDARADTVDRQCRLLSFLRADV